MFDFNRNTSKIAAWIFAAVVLTAGLGIALAAGGAVAQSDLSEVDNSTIEIDNSTESAYADVTTVDDYNGSDDPDVEIAVVGVEQDQDVDNGTEIHTDEKTNVSNATTESFTYELTDEERESYDRVHITVESTDESLIDSADLGVLQQVTGGGGGLLDGAGLGTPAIVVVALGAFVLFMRD